MSGADPVKPAEPDNSGEPAGSAGSLPPRSFGGRVVGALRLDPKVYTEIEHDPSSLGQAAIVVTLVAAAAGLGNSIADSPNLVILSIFTNLAAWAFSAAIIWLVGVAWMGHDSAYPELLRTIGFASAPQGLYFFQGSEFGMYAFVLGLVWSLAAYVVAVRETLDVTTGRAIGVCLLANGLVLLAVITLIDF